MQKRQQLLIIFGPPVSGKMTVGKAICEKLGYQLFHNHQVIELVKNYFDINDHPFWPLLSKIRRTIFEEVAASYLEGFVIPYIWDLNSESDREYIDRIVELFEEKLWQVRFIELSAKLGTRIKRSKNTDRLDEKPMKADFAKVEAEIMEYEDYMTNTVDEFIYPHQYVKIDTTKLTPDQVADEIIKTFSLDDLPEQEFDVERE